MGGKRKEDGRRRRLVEYAVDRSRERERERERESMVKAFRLKIAGDPSPFEESVAQALVDLEKSNGELKAYLKDLYITSAKEIDIGSGRKAIVIHVPFRLL